MQWLYSAIWVLLPLIGCNKGHQMGMYSGEQSEETNSEKNNNGSYSQGGFLRRCDYKCKECEFYCEGPAQEVMVSREAHRCTKRGCTNCLELHKCKCSKYAIRSSNNKKVRCNKCCRCSKSRLVFFSKKKSSRTNGDGDDCRSTKRTNGDGDDCRSTNTDMTLL